MSVRRHIREQWAVCIRIGSLGRAEDGVFLRDTDSCLIIQQAKIMYLSVTCKQN
jgi:hypothetical protein